MEISCTRRPFPTEVAEPLGFLSEEPSLLGEPSAVHGADGGIRGTVPPVLEHRFFEQ